MWNIYFEGMEGWMGRSGRGQEDEEERPNMIKIHYSVYKIFQYLIKKMHFLKETNFSMNSCREVAVMVMCAPIFSMGR